MDWGALIEERDSVLNAFRVVAQECGGSPRRWLFQWKPLQMTKIVSYALQTRRHRCEDICRVAIFCHTAAELTPMRRIEMLIARIPTGRSLLALGILFGVVASVLLLPEWPRPFGRPLPLRNVVLGSAVPLLAALPVVLFVQRYRNIVIICSLSRLFLSGLCIVVSSTAFVPPGYLDEAYIFLCFSVLTLECEFAEFLWSIWRPDYFWVDWVASIASCLVYGIGMAWIARSCYDVRARRIPKPVSVACFDAACAAMWRVPTTLTWTMLVALCGFSFACAVALRHRMVWVMAAQPGAIIAAAAGLTLTSLPIVSFSRRLFAVFVHCTVLRLVLGFCALATYLHVPWTLAAPKPLLHAAQSFVLVDTTMTLLLAADGGCTSVGWIWAIGAAISSSASLAYGLSALVLARTCVAAPSATGSGCPETATK